MNIPTGSTLLRAKQALALAKGPLASLLKARPLVNLQVRAGPSHHLASLPRSASRRLSGNRLSGNRRLRRKGLGLVSLQLSVKEVLLGSRRD
jgi:hypothetical protein